MLLKNVLVFGILLVLGLMGTTCRQEAERMPFLFNKTWLHSVEEDSADVNVYRPNTYSFPPSRGRTGFSLDANGSFRLLSIAPTDGLEEHPGRWKMVKKDLLKVTFADSASEDFNLKIISALPEKLTVKRATEVK
jgi:hypothetical protein